MEDDDSEMNSSAEDLSQSDLVTEDDLIDSLFLACDDKNIGNVTVSSLIEYLKYTSSAISENEEDLHDLEILFTQKGETINIASYRTVMKQWIYSIRKRNELESDQEDVLDQVKDTSICLSKDISILNASNMDSSVVGTYVTDFDQVDQQNKIEDLKYQNKKLTDENTKLQQQIDIQEDLVTSNNTEIDRLHKKIKSLQTVADSRQEYIEENEELKVTVSKLQDKKAEIESRVTHLERERSVFETECTELKIKVNELATTLENVSTLKENLNKELAECRHELVHAKELKSIQEVQLHERYLEVKSLTQQLQDVQSELQECHKEKDEMKMELVQSLQDMSRPLPTEAGAMGDVMPSAAGSFVCSTPMRGNQSLCMELKGLIGHDKLMPSPLCPKEYHKEYKLNLLPVFDEEEEGDGGEEVTDYHLTEDLSHFTDKFKHKQSELLAEIDSYFRQEECGEKQEKLHSSLQKELAEMTEQMAALAIAKDSANRKISKLNQSMKKTKEENAILRRMQHDSHSMLVECDRDLQNTSDRRLMILRDKLEEEKDLVRNLKKELEEKSKMIQRLEKEHKEDKSERLKEEIMQLKRSNMDLTEKCSKAEAQINCLQDDITKSEKDVEIEKLRTYELEESLYSSKLSRQMDLKEIWRLVHKDVEAECHDDRMIENSIGESNDAIKTRIVNEILTLQSEIKSNIQTESTPSHKCSCFGTSNTNSSPLVEALTIDFYNGNRTLSHLSTDNLPHRKSCDNLNDILNKGSEGLTSSRSLDTLTDASSVTTVIHVRDKRKFSQDSLLSDDIDKDINRNRLFSQNSLSSSTGCLIEGESPSDDNGNFNAETTIVSNNSLRRLSYQAAIDPDTDDTFHSMAAFNSHVEEKSDISYTSCDDGLSPLPQSYSINDNTCSHQEVDAHSLQELTDQKDIGSPNNHCDKSNRLNSLRKLSGGTKKSCAILTSKSLDMFSSVELGDDDVFLDNVPVHNQRGPDYCWDDNMVMFDNDTSYSSYSFSHLSYPFQPLRQDNVRHVDSSMNCDKDLIKTSAGEIFNLEESLDAVICAGNLSHPHEVSVSSESSTVSVTTALAKDLEKLSLDDSVEKTSVSEESSHVNMLQKTAQGLTTDMKLTSSQIRQNNLARRREQMKYVSVMPDLKESGESLMSSEDQMSNQGSKVKEAHGKEVEHNVEQNGDLPPGFMENGEPSVNVEKAVFPSIPNSFLKKHQLNFKKDEDIKNSIHQLSDTEVEQKFTSLSLAFKTDKLTLDKRLEIQERYRDLSEQNVDKEIQGLKGALETISHLPECVDAQVQDVLKKIRKHIDVLSQASTKVSSRAEVYGAVQQEKRMSKAIEVMIAHVENLKMAYEREHSELEDARKLIQDGRPFGAFNSEPSFGSKRSNSVCQGIGLTKPTRRRGSEISPRSGHNGTLSHSQSLPQNLKDLGKTKDIIDTTKLGFRRDPREDEDVKAKFQNVIASTLKKTSVTSSLRTNSSDQISLSSREPSLEGEKTISKQNSKEEDAFQKGFEQGYKAQVRGDLAYLREQQNTVSQTLENIMDDVENENEQEDKNLSQTIKEKFWELIPSWEVASKKLRFTMAGFVFFMALCSIILSFFPVGQAAMQIHPRYRHMGPPL